MLKLLALDDRYRNIRGPEEARHDREEARTHAADIVAILRAQVDPRQFRLDFERQFDADRTLGLQVVRILISYFRERTSPGFLVYEEFPVADRPLDQATRIEIRREVEMAHKDLLRVFPPLL